MKNNLENNFSHLLPLSENEMIDVTGGMGFWEAVGYIPGVIIGSILVVAKSAAEYQASLPPNLKK